MSRLAKFQLAQEDREKINLGLPIRLHTFGGRHAEVRARSLQHVNPEAWADHLFELTVGDTTVILSASELLQVLQSV